MDRDVWYGVLFDKEWSVGAALLEGLENVIAPRATSEYIDLCTSGRLTRPVGSVQLHFNLKAVRYWLQRTSHQYSWGAIL
jgi:hypothetical protein